MTGTINFKNAETNKFSLSIKNGDCIICSCISSDMRRISVNDTIEFDKRPDCTYFYHIKSGERLTASIVHMDINCSRVESYCKEPKPH